MRPVLSVRFPQYGITGGKLHPLVVGKDRHFSDVGSFLLNELEKVVAQQSGVTFYLVSDDKENKTSLAGDDAYENLCEKIKDFQDLNQYPYEFYQKCGYKTIG